MYSPCAPAYILPVECAHQRRSVRVNNDERETVRERGSSSLSFSPFFPERSTRNFRNLGSPRGSTRRNVNVTFMHEIATSTPTICYASTSSEPLIFPHCVRASINHGGAMEYFKRRIRLLSTFLDRYRDRV